MSQKTRGLAASPIDIATSTHQKTRGVAASRIDTATSTSQKTQGFAASPKDTATSTSQKTRAFVASPIDNATSTQQKTRGFAASPIDTATSTSQKTRGLAASPIAWCCLTVSWFPWKALTWNWVYHVWFSFMSSLLLYCEAAAVFLLARFASWFYVSHGQLVALTHVPRFHPWHIKWENACASVLPKSWTWMALNREVEHPGWTVTVGNSVRCGPTSFVDGVTGFYLSDHRLWSDTEVTLGSFNEVNKCPTPRMRQFVGWF